MGSDQTLHIQLGVDVGEGEEVVEGGVGCCWHGIGRIVVVEGGGVQVDDSFGVVVDVLDTLLSQTETGSIIG